LPPLYFSLALHKINENFVYSYYAKSGAKERKE